jgi:hypothetical protein
MRSNLSISDGSPSRPLRRQTPALERFLALSPCPFAQHAEIMQFEPWSDRQIEASKLNRLYRALSRFVDTARFDLGVLEVRGAGDVTKMATWARWLHGVLLGLRERDTTISEPLTEGISDPGWDFCFENGAFFVSLFAPIYPPTHSRWSVEKNVAFLLMQPERGFRRFGVSSHRCGRKKLSEAVHHRFKRYGQRYDLLLNLESAKALRYVKPLRPGDLPIAWWEHPYEPNAMPAIGRADPR